MTRVFVDTNVLLDAMLGREPFVADALRILEITCGAEPFRAVVSSCSLSTVYFFLRQALREGEARHDLSDLLARLEVESVDTVKLRRALLRPGRDLEDDIQIECAVAAGCDAILTRNVRHFQQSPIVAVTPGEWLAGLA